MRGRFVSLVVVIVLVAAPLAHAICEVSCEDGAHRSEATVHAHHAPAGSMPGHHHAAKHEPNTETAKALCCANPERPLASVAATKNGMQAPAIELTLFTVIDHRARDVSMVTIRSTVPAASPPSLHTPLRV